MWVLFATRTNPWLLLKMNKEIECPICGATGTKAWVHCPKNFGAICMEYCYQPLCEFSGERDGLCEYTWRMELQRKEEKCRRDELIKALTGYAVETFLFAQLGVQKLLLQQRCHRRNRTHLP